MQTPVSRSTSPACRFYRAGRLGQGALLAALILPWLIAAARPIERPMKITILTRHLEKLYQAEQVKRTRLGHSEQEPAHVGMELAKGDLLQSYSPDILVEITCPGRSSPARLSGRFRVVILPHEGACTFDLQSGRLDILATEPTEVGLAGAVAGSRDTIYSVRMDDPNGGSIPRVLVFDGRVTVRASGQEKIVPAGSKINYEATVLSSDQKISDQDFHESADVHALLVTGKVRAPGLESIYERLRSLQFEVLRNPSTRALRAELARAEAEYGVKDEANYYLRPAYPPEPPPPDPDNHHAGDATPGREERSARINARINVLAHQLKRLASTDDLRLRRIKNGETLRDIYPGLELFKGDVLESASKEIEVEITCVKGSLVRLAGQFRIAMSLDETDCSFDLQMGNVDVLAQEPIGVSFAGAHVASRNGVFAVKLLDGEAAGLRIASLPRVLVFGGQVRISARGQEEALKPGARVEYRAGALSKGIEIRGDGDVQDSAKVHALLETSKAEISDLRPEDVFSLLNKLQLDVLQDPANDERRADLGLMQAGFGLRREANDNLRPLGSLNPHLSLHGNLSRESKWISEDGNWNSEGCYAVSRTLIDRATALDPASVFAQPGLEPFRHAEHAAGQALRLNAEDNLLTPEQRDDCHRIVAGKGVNNSSEDYCQRANEIRGTQRELARLIALEGIRRNGIDRALQGSEFLSCIQLAEIGTAEDNRIDTRFLCAEASTVYEKSRELAKAYARIGLHVNHAEPRLSVGELKMCQNLALGKSP